MEPIKYGDPAMRADPYPLYKELRKSNPVVKATQGYMGEVVLVTRYEDVLAGLKHPLLSSDLKKSGGMRMDIFDAWWVPKVFKSIQDSMVPPKRLSFTPISLVLQIFVEMSSISLFFKFFCKEHQRKDIVYTIHDQDIAFCTFHDDTHFFITSAFSFGHHLTTGSAGSHCIFHFKVT